MIEVRRGAAGRLAQLLTGDKGPSSSLAKDVAMVTTWADVVAILAMMENLVASSKWARRDSESRHLGATMTQHLCVNCLSRMT